MGKLNLRGLVVAAAADKVGGEVAHNRGRPVV